MNKKDLKRLALFRKYFDTPNLVCGGIRMITLDGDLPVGRELAARVGLPANARMFDYADFLLSYAEERGWTQRINERLAWIIHDFASKKRKGALKE